ncbi:hypothetical protein EXIGLDRAFT_765281 [Exidia glandulosa HHB12029]|uniref:Uncharacterized protein n=1 Tax=Exidia glandulosa HHB12029 TaxID=1314781 RepID=A0A165KK93_EXIGL|nr:hypothetical protein EXIGLDRAFT_765281 [Exidia glandulosa HHB12029]
MAGAARMGPDCRFKSRLRWLRTALTADLGVTLMLVFILSIGEIQLHSSPYGSARATTDEVLARVSRLALTVKGASARPKS